MKLANTIFAIGIGVYYVIGDKMSIFWADYYYAIVFGYICSLISNSKLTGWHRAFAYIVSITIWAFYMLKQLLDVVDTDIAQWARWFLGFIFVVSAIVYYFKTPKENED